MALAVWLCGACLQIVVLDKLDYCASVNNLESVIDQPNVKVRGRAGAVKVVQGSLRSAQGSHGVCSWPSSFR